MLAMWFLLSLFALVMLVSRRSVEKNATKHISSMSLAWLQQMAAMPFILVSLFFAPFFLPSEINGNFWVLLALYALVNTFDSVAYFKALSLSDISFIAPLMSLFVVSNMFFTYAILGQIPSFLGLFGALSILFGVYLSGKRRPRTTHSSKNDKIAAILVLTSVLSRGLLSSLDVLMSRQTNPVSFNFYSSLSTVIVVLMVHRALVYKRDKGRNFWCSVTKEIKGHHLVLLFIGLTYTLYMLATYQAKLIAPNAAYVGTIKQSQVVPMILVGVLFFKEEFYVKQWGGVMLIIFGLICIGLN